ncbi:glycosyltransferase, group 2 family protein [Haemophilus parainfluenzae ATCC 33392]|uniref:Glycosyltransferase family 2 protein n=1 Tax=Haemophilus parainfluenzae ATCC 33392 TaxID=888828 RepID=A0ABD7ZDZ9_HAEPA|nr:glycosyltransferase family 2 protein [Haemophilus parainfluenzae]EGC73009.1 glycosyltransferase, group 2 family protein [Haemophilus parainfluenzae ATCC 33392]KFL99547.1 glycosyltransferase, group 2 family protein [Haemophilus parainfluenzae ATCC 33392]QQB23136.1 glycosyltransferase family 2 protein [Haemophilus parainfluenzae]WMS22908.1 glycosyltransferase family 2 protein [Haemophilus parainfluenzae ATCC 33392]STO94476.1 Hyaluronan synthase [Haemophilus parainfluenzae ATCC 33392]
MIKFTIFTPAYNRAHTLRRCYESILAQDNLEELEWLLINDGSNDNTDDIVDSLISENKLNIRYIKQENSGKQFSWNKAISLAKGLYFIGLDSDDTFRENSLFSIISDCNNLLDKDNIVGIRCLAINNMTNKPSGRLIENKLIEMTWFDEFSNSKNFGERIDILKTDVIKKFLYPVDSDIIFIPEIWFYIKLAKKGYKFIYSPKALRVFFDDATENRLSRSNIFKHAKGHYISRSAMIKDIPLLIWIKNPLSYIKTIIRFSQMAKYLNKSLVERASDSNYFSAILSYLIGFFIKVEK